MEDFLAQQEVFVLDMLVQRHLAVGGPIAVFKNGDVIDIDAKKGNNNIRLTKNNCI